LYESGKNGTVAGANFERNLPTIGEIQIIVDFTIAHEEFIIWFFKWLHLTTPYGETCKEHLDTWSRHLSPIIWTPVFDAFWIHLDAIDISKYAYDSTHSYIPHDIIIV
jgi:hypothetical protein